MDRDSDGKHIPFYVYGERMIRCPECGLQYANEDGECMLCEDGGPEAVAEAAIDWD